MFSVLFRTLLPLLLLASVHASEQFGDITASTQPFASGETYHGYGEFRVLLENRSIKTTHRVRLVFPDHSYTSGNSISRISRTVTIAPNSQVMVPFWQPALPANGSASVRVEVDDEPPGSMNMPQHHATRYGYGSGTPAAILVSRSLNYDDAARVFKGDSGDSFTAKMATGAPDSRGRRGTVATAWAPDPSTSSAWLELDYSTPVRADRVRICDNNYLYDGQIILIGESGTNRTTARITPPSGRYSPGSTREFTFPLTPEPVKTVRLEFGSTHPSSISIDAVELVGPTNRAWASDARASSDGHSSFAGSSRSGYEPTSTLRAELPVDQWSDNWISYTPFDGILLSAHDLATMPSAVASAVWRYAECGGQLVIFGGATASRPATSSRTNGFELTTFGEVAVPAPWQQMSKDWGADGRIHTVGLGQCFVLSTKSVSSLDALAAKSLTETFVEAARYWQGLPDENAAGSVLPVTENARVPARATVLVMLAFVVLIGPVNLIVLTRLKRRVWMLWTIPAISFATCLFVFAFSLLREGITPTFRSQGLTLLDQANHRATTVGAMGCYCPLTPSGGLKFGYETEVTPLIQVWNYGPFGPSGTKREMDWTQAQNLERGWVSARVPAYFHLRKSETRRERIELEKSGNELSIVNGLGADISRLWLADSDGKIYLLMNNVGAGQKAKLTPATDYPKVSARLGAKGLFKEVGYTTQTIAQGRNTADFLLPGTYVAELKENPFLEKSLSGKTKPAPGQTHSLVYGILEGGHGL